MHSWCWCSKTVLQPFPVAAAGRKGVAGVWIPWLLGSHSWEDLGAARPASQEPTRLGQRSYDRYTAWLESRAGIQGPLSVRGAVAAQRSSRATSTATFGGARLSASRGRRGRHRKPPLVAHGCQDVTRRLATETVATRGRCPPAPRGSALAVVQLAYVATIPTSAIV